MLVIALLPLLFNCLYRGMRTGKIRYFLWLGFLIAIDVFSAHLQMVHFSLLAVGFYFVFELVYLLLKEKSRQAAAVRTGFFVLAVMIGLGIGSRGFLPQYVYNKTESKRAGQQGEGLTKSYAGSWGLHTEEIASLVVPEFGNYDVKQQRLYWGKNAFKINADYFGGIVFILALLSILIIRKNRNILFFYILMFIGLLFALGNSTPVFTIMYHTVPGMKTFRSPALMMFVSAFSAFVLAGIFLTHVFAEKSRKSAAIASYVFFAAAVICLFGAFNPKLYLTPWNSLFYSNLGGGKLEIFNRNIPELKTGFLISFLFFVTTAAGLYLFSKKKLSFHVVIIMLIPLFLIDFWRIDRDFLNYTPVTLGVDPYGLKDPAYDYLVNLDEGPFRVMPMHIRSLQDKFYYPGLSMVSGFHDFCMYRYDRMMKNVPGLGAAGLQNFVKLTSGKYLVFAEQRPEAIFSSSRYSIAENREALPYFYVRDVAIVQPNQEYVINFILSGAVNLDQFIILEETPPKGISTDFENDSLSVNYTVDIVKAELSAGDVEVNVTLDKHGMFIFSENYHSKWRCFVDGAEQRIYHANYLLQAVYLEPGEHNVKFQFYDPVIRLSRNFMYIFLMLFLILLILDYRGILERVFSHKKTAEIQTKD